VLFNSEIYFETELSVGNDPVQLCFLADRG